jgi:1,4-dihydroxy-2-naphthoyl-CoA hydrolase
MKQFSHKMHIDLCDTDMAGVVYFGNFFTLAHRTLGAFYRSLGVSIRDNQRNENILMPIVHAEADYFHPLYAQDEIEIKLLVDRIGNTSFGIRYEIFNGERLVSVVKTVHVVIKNNMKMPLNASFKELLSSYIVPSVIPGSR